MQNAPAPVQLSCPIVTNVGDSEINVGDESRLACEREPWNRKTPRSNFRPVLGH